jgi:hypothetical protein
MPVAPPPHGDQSHDGPTKPVSNDNVVTYGHNGLEFAIIVTPIDGAIDQTATYFLVALNPFGTSAPLDRSVHVQNGSTIITISNEMKRVMPVHVLVPCGGSTGNITGFGSAPTFNFELHRAVVALDFRHQNEPSILHSDMENVTITIVRAGNSEATGKTVIIERFPFVVGKSDFNATNIVATIAIATHTVATTTMFCQGNQIRTEDRTLDGETGLERDFMLEHANDFRHFSFI